jgi:hypothetical protein
MFVDGVALDERFLGALEEMQHDVVVEGDDGGDDCDDGVGGVDEEEGCDQDSAEFEEVEDVLDDDVDLLVVLGQERGTWLHLSAMKGEWVNWYHLMSFWLRDPSDFW